MNLQSASRVMMVRPASFGYNEETASTNYFQNKITSSAIPSAVLKEFDDMVLLLRNNGIDVIVINDTGAPPKPDAIFPNNWFSCKNNKITLFPMYASNRRTEKRKEVIEEIAKLTGCDRIVDMSHYESQLVFLEGTGSMVCDHINQVIYACRSQRTDESLVKEYASANGYDTCIFTATDKEGNEIYHTNVMMCIADGFAIICADAIDDSDRERVTCSLIDSGHELIRITRDQMYKFAGNMLHLSSHAGSFLLMSKTASASLNEDQMSAIKKYASPLIADVTNIERTGGGSVRCMVAELF